MDQANLVDFAVMQSWTEKLMKTRVDVPPAGFQKPTMKQLMAADVKFFEELSDMTRAGVEANAKGRPLDLAIPQVIHMPEVMSLMPDEFARLWQSERHSRPSPSEGPICEGQG